jgi:hypothetical protein
MEISVSFMANAPFLAVIVSLSSKTRNIALSFSQSVPFMVYFGPLQVRCAGAPLGANSLKHFEHHIFILAALFISSSSLSISIDCPHSSQFTLSVAAAFSCSTNASAGRTDSWAGTWTFPPHFGHLPFLPAASSATDRCFPQFGHANLITLRPSIFSSQGHILHCELASFRCHYLILTFALSPHERHIVRQVCGGLRRSRPTVFRIVGLPVRADPAATHSVVSSGLPTPTMRYPKYRGSFS